MQKCIAFTICANNYLAHATVLAESFKKNNSTTEFWIVIADERCGKVVYETLHADKVVFIQEIISTLELETLSRKFNITEFCTAIKPDVLLYLQRLGYVFCVYLDPDIEVFYQLEYIFDLLEQHAIILTPHICSSKKLDLTPNDYQILRTGVYNLGFGAFNLDVTANFIKWWKNRVIKYGYRIDAKGMFYDQIWMSYAPAFEGSTHILRDLGCNVANWNLHERTLLCHDGNYFVNHLNNPLKFFHYSHFKINDLPRIAAYNKDFTIENREDINPLFLNYKAQLEAKGIKFYEEIQYAYGCKAGYSKSDKIKARKNLTKDLTLYGKIRQSYKFLKKAAKILLS